MKHRLTTLIIVSILAAACSDGISVTPGISFLTPEPEIFEETAIFRMIGQPYAQVDSVKIPVIFGGTAERGTDYEASADHFIFSNESPTDSIVISTKRLGTGKNVSLSLQIPEGFTAGKHTTSGFTLQDKFGLLSFASSRGYIADTTEFVISLYDSTGRAKALSKDCPIGISIDPDRTTAVEGVDFKLIGASSPTIAGGGSSTGFKIVPLNGNPQEGRDRIVFSVTEDERFGRGTFPELEIGLLRSELKVLDGKWQIDTLVTDSLHFESIWGDQCSGYEFVPKFSRSDAFEMSLQSAMFTPSFSSDLRRYFIGESNIGFGDRIDITAVDGSTKKVQLLSLDNTNRYFSADTTSTDSLSFIGLYLTKEAETEADMLELYILDHTSMSFMSELESEKKYGSEKPVATAPGMYLEATFLKRK